MQIIRCHGNGPLSFYVPVVMSVFRPWGYKNRRDELTDKLVGPVKRRTQRVSKVACCL